MSRKQKRVQWCIVVLGLLSIMAVWMWGAEGNPLGQEVYKSKCVICHGEDGKGQTKAGKLLKTPDLTEMPWKHGNSQASVEQMILEGAGKMKGYKDKLNSEEITAVAQHIRLLAVTVE